MRGWIEVKVNVKQHVNRQLPAYCSSQGTLLSDCMKKVVLTNVQQKGSALENYRHLWNMHLEPWLYHTQGHSLQFWDLKSEQRLKILKTCIIDLGSILVYRKTEESVMNTQILCYYNVQQQWHLPMLFIKRNKKGFLIFVLLNGSWFGPIPRFRNDVTDIHKSVLNIHSGLLLRHVPTSCS